MYLSYSSAQHFADTGVHKHAILCQFHVIYTIMKVYRQTKLRSTFLYRFSVNNSKHTECTHIQQEAVVHVVSTTDMSKASWLHMKTEVTSATVLLTSLTVQCTRAVACSTTQCWKPRWITVHTHKYWKTCTDLSGPLPYSSTASPWPLGHCCFCACSRSNSLSYPLAHKLLPMKYTPLLVCSVR